MSTDTVNGQIIYQWITDYTNLIQPEIYSPPITEFLPRVSVFPLQFKYVIEGAQDNWENFGNWLYRLSANCSDLPVQQQEETRIRVKNISDDREKIPGYYIIGYRTRPATLISLLKREVYCLIRLPTYAPTNTETVKPLAFTSKQFWKVSESRLIIHCICR